MLTFYPTVSHGELGKYAHNVPCMLLPVSSWAAYKLRQQGKHGLTMDKVIGDIPVPKIPAAVREVAADCGGFVATRKWGSYRYSAGQYVKWLQGLSQLSWAATMDFCCENEITSGQPGIVRMRQDATTDMAHHFWQTYRDVPWVWVPTVQGWEIADYERHAQELKPLIDEMQAHYGPDSAFRVGIGTLCARASVEMIQDVVLAVAAILPDAPLHLWGVKLGLAKSPIAIPEQVISLDSGAWNGMFGHGRNLWKETPYSQREWCLKVALPAYEQKLQNALTNTKQARMF